MTRGEIAASVEQFCAERTNEWATLDLEASHGDLSDAYWEARRVLRGSQASRYETLCAWLGSADDAELYHALFPLACSGAGSSKPDLAAGHLLLYLKPVCPVSCPEAVRAVATSEWDISLEEVPWYIASSFGTEAVSLAIGALLGEGYFHGLVVARQAWCEANPIPLGPFPKEQARAMHERSLHLSQPPGDDLIRLETVKWWVEGCGSAWSGWEPFWRQ